MSRHPQWKRAYALKAARVNEATSVKAVARRLGISPDTVSNWRWQDRKRMSKPYVLCDTDTDNWLGGRVRITWHAKGRKLIRVGR